MCVQLFLKMEHELRGSIPMWSALLIIRTVIILHNIADPNFCMVTKNE